MTARLPSGDQQVQFLLQIQRLLEESLFVASYKPALLIALADVAVELGTDGEPLTVTTRQLAERFIRLYWRQVVPYVPGKGRGGAVLWQNTGNQAAIVNVVAEARAEYGHSHAAFKRETAPYGKVVTRVASVIHTMPLWKLQTVGSERLTFLYDNVDTGNEVTLKSTAVFCLRRFHTLVVDLAQTAWFRFLWSLKKNADVLGTAQDLREFLFGSDRASLDAHRGIIEEFQDGACFYCDRALNRDAAVDHFIPWARYSVDLGHNFVVAHETCNRNKSDRLAAYDHLRRWATRNHERGRELARTFDGEGVPHDLDATWQIARWAYHQAETVGAEVWLRGRKSLVPLDEGWSRLPGLRAG